MALGAHLWMCKGCPNDRDQMRALRDAARAYAAGQALMADSNDVQPPPGSDGVWKRARRLLVRKGTHFGEQ